MSGVDSAALSLASEGGESDTEHSSSGEEGVFPTVNQRLGMLF